MGIPKLRVVYEMLDLVQDIRERLAQSEGTLQ